MSSSKYKNKYGLSRKQEKDAAKYFGKHITTEKAVFLLVATLLACAMPMLIGYRLWESIPEIVETGLIGANGNDDSMPRGVLVYGLPGLMCVLNLICHGQLFINQKAQRIPPASSRIIGRWGFPILSVFCVSICLLNAAGQKVSAAFLIPCALAMLLMFLGSHFFDCKRDSNIALHFRFMEYKEDVWRIAHRIAGICWAAAGLLMLFLVMFTGSLPIWSLFTVLVLMAVPVFAGYVLSRKSAL